MSAAGRIPSKKNEWKQKKLAEKGKCGKNVKDPDKLSNIDPDLGRPYKGVNRSPCTPCQGGRGYSDTPYLVGLCGGGMCCNPLLEILYSLFIRILKFLRDSESEEKKTKK